MSAYQSSVVGLAYEARGDYIRQNVIPGDALTLRAEPDNRYDPDAVAVFHQWQKIGYVPAGSQWLAEALEKDLVVEVIAGRLEYDEYAIPVILQIEVTIVDEPVPTAPASPPPAFPTDHSQQSVTKPSASKRLAIIILFLVAIIVACGIAWLYLQAW